MGCWAGRFRSPRASALLAVLVAALGANFVACSGAGSRTGATPAKTSPARASGKGASGAPAGTGSAPRYLNDGDAEQADDHDIDNRPGDHEDGDADSHGEYESGYGNGDYHDADDGTVLSGGRPAGAAEEREATALVKRYYATAVAGEGARACAMLVPVIARSIPEDYGRAPGPAFLRGARTCPAVMSRLFKHLRRRLTGRFEVTGMRVAGDYASVLLGSTAMPSGYIALRRERGVWRIAEPLGGALP